MSQRALLVALVAIALLAPLGATGAQAQAQATGWIVTFEQGSMSEGLAGLPADVEVLHTYRSFPGALVVATDAAARSLVGLDAVERVDPDAPLEPHLDLARTLLRLDEARGASLDVRGDGVTVAIVDSGIDATHPGLDEGKIVDAVTITDTGATPASVDEQGHGTHVAGIVAGTGEASPEQRYQGLAPSTRLVDVDLGEDWTVDKAVRAFEWLATNHSDDVPVVVSSFGRTAGANAFDPGDPLVRATDALVDQGKLVLFSAGNRGPGPGTMSNEALNPRVLAVGATDEAGRPLELTSRGPPGSGKPDLYAPGESVITTRATSARLTDNLVDLTVDQGRNRAPAFYVQATGTSVANPAVAGLAADLWSLQPDAELRDIRDALENGTIAPPGRPGVRVLDAAHAVARLQHAPPPVLGAMTLETTESVLPANLDLLGGGALGQTHIPFPVSAWTQDGEVTVAWSTSIPGAGFRAILLDPEGSMVGEPIEEQGGSLALTSEPAPGVWRVQIEGASEVSEGTLTASLVTSEARELAPVEPLTPAEDGQGTSPGEQGRSGPIATGLGAALLLAALGGGVYAYTRRR